MNAEFTILLLFSILFVYVNLNYAYLQVTISNNNNLQQNLKHKSYYKQCADIIFRPIVLLINHIAENYFNNCHTILLYDDYFYFNEKHHEIIDQLLITYPISLTQGRIITANTTYQVIGKTLKLSEVKNQAYILLTKEIETGLEVIGPQPISKVVLITQVSQWQINNFLSRKSGIYSNKILNLLIIADPSLQLEEFNGEKKDINMYTQNLYADPLGDTKPQILTAWRCNYVTRPNINLFPNKLKSGFNGHMFKLAGAQQPPFVFRKRDQMILDYEDRVTTWDGNEIRLLRFVGEILNFTLTIIESKDSGGDSAKRALKDLLENKADIAAAGIHLTASRMKNFTFSIIHSQDCANFITLTSTALPKYRAIMGPFQLEVWLGLIVIYMFAVIPIAFSAKHSLKYLIDDPKEIENLFWYVFGTFTNCFTFSGKGSWTSENRNATRLFIGIYWVFTIIITAAYTGCIIAFITLPAYPAVVDTAKDLLLKNYKIGVIHGSDWKSAFENSSDPVANALFKSADFVPNIETGLYNVSKSIYRQPYSFLGSKEELKYIIKTKFTPGSRHRKSRFHLCRECFVPIMLSIAFPKDSIYVNEINMVMLRIIETGFYKKLSKDVEWDQYRASTGKFLEVSSSTLKLGAPEDRQLTLDDTQGMFLLLGIGFSLAVFAFLIECYIKIHKNILNCTKTLNNRNISNNPSITIISYDGLMSYFGSKVRNINSLFYHNSVDTMCEKKLTSISLLELSEPKSTDDNCIRRYSY